MQNSHSSLTKFSHTLTQVKKRQGQHHGCRSNIFFPLLFHYLKKSGAGVTYNTFSILITKNPCEFPPIIESESEFNAPVINCVFLCSY